MTTGSQSDLIGRLQTWLPSRWFPTQAQNGDGSVPRIYALLAGAAATLAQVWTQLQYARAQTRLSTSTDGWLDLGIADFMGDILPRNPGESDAAYWARAQPQLLPKANTRPNLRAALTLLTGNSVRMIEAFDPRDTAVWGHSFYGVDTEDSPGCYANGAARYNGFVECVLPAVSILGDEPQGFFYDSLFYNNGFYWDGQLAGEGGAGLVYALINRLKVFGTQVWVKFVPPPGVDDPFVLGTSLLGGSDVLQ